MTVSLMTLFAILSDSSAGVLLGTGGVILAFWLIGLLPKSAKYMPTFLTDGYSLIRGITEAEAYVPALFAAAAVSTVSFAASIPLFNKKPL